MKPTISDLAREWMTGKYKTALDLAIWAMEQIEPEGQFIRVPPLEEWPPTATHLHCIYFDGNEPFEDYETIQRPAPGCRVSS